VCLEWVREVRRVHQKLGGREAPVSGRSVRGGVSGVFDLEGVVRDSRKGWKSVAHCAPQVKRTSHHGTQWVRRFRNLKISQINPDLCWQSGNYMLCLSIKYIGLTSKLLLKIN
jgi:hypothetical protein